MQISIETTTQTARVLTASSGSHGAVETPNDKDGDAAKAPALSVLEAASKKAEEDAVVISALQQAVEKRRGESDEDSQKAALASIEDYQETAGKLKTALGDSDIRSEGVEQLLSYESATISTTTIEAEIGGNTLSAEFISFERVSLDSETGLSVRSASASNIEADFGNVSANYQSASVNSLYSGTANQVGNLLSGSI